ncbi:MAG: universal stress protein [Ardenticatenaceae bacterium]|nr:universal stress protein [Ardenticatenaceae bacterium]MCB9443393.1 universal stress protein [Ardenticatenaceae bacterium]
MVETDIANQSAKEDFRRARRQAALQQVYNRMIGKHNDLLAYDDIRRALKAQTQIERGLQEIPLDAIVGSVGRYTDFTRSFLPLSDSLEERWARVYAVATEGSGWPPIQLYKVGDAYFVLDGNHRVSVARQLEMDTIQAYVTEVVTKVPLTPDAKPDEMICKARYAEFLERTDLDKLRPQARLNVTAPGAYRILDEHIRLHQYYMGLEQQRDISYLDAAASWYDDVYLPIIQVVREKDLLHEFPDRTETDLYIWLTQHRAELEESLGWNISTQAAAADLVDMKSEKPGLARVGKRIIDAVVPDELQTGPAKGEWQRQTLIQRYLDKLFNYVLVPVSGEEQSWQALEQAIVVARRENSELRGLHLVPGETVLANPDAETVQAQFARRCEEAGVNGRLITETGPIAKTIIDRARWNDLVVMNLAHPPGKTVAARLESGFRQVIQRSPRPILAVPHTISPLDKALLAYDGSDKAKEALFMAAYLAEQWHIQLVAVIAHEKKAVNTAVTDHARRYLELHEIDAQFVIESAPAADLIMDTAASCACNLIIMGGYGAQPVVEAVLGSTANEILRRTTIPILICP